MVSISTLKAVAGLVERGATWSTAAARHDLSASWAYRRCVAQFPDLRRRRKPRLTDDQRDEIRGLIEAAEQSYRSIAASVGVSPDTVSRIAQAAIDDHCEGLPRVRRIRSSRRCETCGAKIQTATCIACQAKQYRTAQGHR